MATAFLLVHLHDKLLVVGNGKFRQAEHRLLRFLASHTHHIVVGTDRKKHLLLNGGSLRHLFVHYLERDITSIPPSELEFGEDEPEDGTPDTPRATGSSFDEIDDAVRAAKNPEAKTAERERAAKVFSDMEGTELYEKLMSGSTELSIRIKGLIEVRLKKPKKEFTVPDNIDEFNIRDYV